MAIAFTARSVYSPRLTELYTLGYRALVDAVAGALRHAVERGDAADWVDPERDAVQAAALADGLAWHALCAPGELAVADALAALDAHLARCSPAGTEAESAGARGVAQPLGDALRGADPHDGGHIRDRRERRPRPPRPLRRADQLGDPEGGRAGGPHAGEDLLGRLVVARHGQRRRDDERGAAFVGGHVADGRAGRQRLRRAEARRPGVAVATRAG